jgi:hypothetical protein
MACMKYSLLIVLSEQNHTNRAGEYFTANFLKQNVHLENNFQIIEEISNPWHFI